MLESLVNQKGWIYICMDLNNPNECKLGMTKRKLYERITETGNPDYMIIKAYNVPPEEALALEKHLQREVNKYYFRKKHFITGKDSEWFLCSPAQAAAALEHDLAKCLCMQDEDGNPNLVSIIFKPYIGPENEFLLATRIRNEECYNNLINAVRNS